MAITFVQQAGNDTNAAGTTVVATFGSAVTSGNVVVAFLSSYSSGQPTVTPSGLTGATWASIRDSNTQLFGHKAIWIATGFTGGTDVTNTLSVTGLRRGITVVEFSGLTATTDGVNSAGGTSTAPATGNITTVNANDLIVIMAATTVTTVTGDPPTGYQQLAQRTTALEQVNDYQIVSATGTYSGSWTWGDPFEWEALIAAFRAAGTDETPSTSFELHSIKIKGATNRP